MKSLALLLALFAAACGPGSPGGPNMGNHMGGGKDPIPQSSPVVSADIMAREPLANTASVKHILISWKDLEDAFQGHQDPRAQARTKTQAEAEVKTLLGQLKAGGDFEALMKEQDVYGYAFEGVRYDAGTTMGWLKASVELALQRQDIGAEFQSYLQTLDLS